MVITVEVILVEAVGTQDNPSNLLYILCPFTHMTLSHTQVPVLITSLSSAEDERGAISLYSASLTSRLQPMLESQRDTFIYFVSCRLLPA